MKISSLNLPVNLNYMIKCNSIKNNGVIKTENHDLGLNSLAFYGRSSIVRPLTESETKKAENIEKIFENKINLRTVLKEQPVFRVMLKRTSVDDIKNNVKSSVDAFKKYGITQSDWLGFCKKIPCLLYFDGNHALNYSIRGVSEDEFFKSLGLTESKYVKVAMEHPQLFYQNPQTIKGNIQGIVEDEYFKKNGLIPKDYINAVMKEPQLFCRNPQTLKYNIQNIVNDECFSSNGLIAKDYIKSATKQPSLFYQSPDRIKTNVQGIVNDEFFSENGLTAKTYIKAALKAPSLFSIKPETIKKNIQDIVNDEYFSENGLTPSDYIKSALKVPTLFYSSADTIKKNVQSITEDDYFKENGLKAKDYIKILTNLPTLFYQNPQTVKGNIKGVVEDEFLVKNGLTIKDYIKSAKKQSSLFAQRPETIKNHIKIYHLMEADKIIQSGKNLTGEEVLNIVNNKNLVYSSEHLFLKFLRNKIYPQIEVTPQELRGNYNMVEKMTKFMQEIGQNEPNKIIPLKIINHEKSQEFVDFVTDFSIKNTGRNHFDIKILS